MLEIATLEEPDLGHKLYRNLGLIQPLNRLLEWVPERFGSHTSIGVVRLPEGPRTVFWPYTRPRESLELALAIRGGNLPGTAIDYLVKRRGLVVADKTLTRLLTQHPSLEQDLLLSNDLDLSAGISFVCETAKLTKGNDVYVTFVSPSYEPVYQAGRALAMHLASEYTGVVLDTSSRTVETPKPDGWLFTVARVLHEFGEHMPRNAVIRSFSGQRASSL